MWQKMLIALSEYVFFPGSGLRESYTEYQLDVLRHAVSTPLSVIGMSLDELQSVTAKDKKALLEKARNSMEAVESALYKLHKTDLQQTCNLSQLITHICIWCSTEQIKVHFTQLPQRNPIYLTNVNPARLQEALLCLIKNAVEASTGSKSATVFVFVIDRQQEITILVKDFGKGMTLWQLWMATLPYISFKRHGHGMGLYFAQKYFHHELHGRVSLHCTSESGCNCECSIPKNQQTYTQTRAL